MATDAKTLLALGRHFVAADASIADMLELALLVQISQQVNPNMATDANSLLAAYKCYQCGETSLAQQLKLALLAQIYTGLAGGGGGGVTQVYSGNYGGVAPVFVPAGATAIAIDTSNGTQWNYYSNAWH